MMIIFFACRPESEEYQDLKKFRRRGRDINKKKRVLTSLEKTDRCVVCENTSSCAFCALLVQVRAQTIKFCLFR